MVSCSNQTNETKTFETTYEELCDTTIKMKVNTQDMPLLLMELDDGVEYTIIPDTVVIYDTVLCDTALLDTIIKEEVKGMKADEEITIEELQYSNKKRSKKLIKKVEDVKKQQILLDSLMNIEYNK